MNIGEQIEFEQIHHIAILCSDYETSKKFYTEILGFKIIHELFREDRQSWKLDLRISDQAQIELFSFPNPPKRPTHPEATGLRHIAFSSQDIVETKQYLERNGIPTEEIRVDPITGKQFFFFQDPDGLPIELYEL